MKLRLPSPIPSDFVTVAAKEIVKKCDGLPFAIEHIAHHLLSSQETLIDDYPWLDVLESANKQLGNYDVSSWSWSYILNLIVKDLSLNLKWCLFYFGLFPKNYAIPVRRLVALWVAEGFVEQRNDKTLEYIAEEYLQELIDLNMVQVTKQKSNGRPKKCCLTNYLHEHLSTRGKQTNHGSSSTSDQSSTSRSTNLWVRQLADHPEVNISAMKASSDTCWLLLSFLSFDYREGYEPGERIWNFLFAGINKSHFEFLRVLDLEGVYNPVLPKEMEKLIHLAYLGLRWTYLDSLPLFVGNLINLQTLDAKHTYISTLPGSIWKLLKLRHVYLNECYLDSFVHQPAGADYLENLQTLFGVHVDEESLPCLSILRLYCNSYIGEHMICSPFGFLRLQVLEIWKVENLKIWNVEKTMPMLKKLEIRSCNNLERLPVGLHATNCCTPRIEVNRYAYEFH